MNPSATQQRSRICRRRRSACRTSRATSVSHSSTNQAEQRRSRAHLTSQPSRTTDVLRRTTPRMRRRVIPSGTAGTGFFRRRVASQRRKSIHCRRQSQWSDGGKPIALPITVTPPFCRSSACWLSHAVVVRFVSRTTLVASLEASTVPARINSARNRPAAGASSASYKSWKRRS